MTKRAIVIGAGPAGLAAASGLTARRVETLTLESDTPGGVARTVRRDGWLAECGPHSFRFQDNRTPRLIVDTGLTGELVDASPAAKKRFVTRDGVPVSPLRALGLPGIARLAAEPFVASGGDDDESVAGYFRRRLGTRAYARLGDAFVGGIHAGDPDKLSLVHAFPQLRRFERDHGSLVRGLLATRAERRAGGRARIAAFRLGMSQLADTAAARLGDTLHTGARVTAIERTSGGWRVAWTGNDGLSRIESADDVVVATPSHAWGTLGLPAAFDPLTQADRTPRYAPVAVVTLGFDRRRVAHPLDGFGLLTPSCERRVSLGILFPSSVFPGRAPHDGVSLAVFIGGARRPELAALTATDLVAIARRECEQLLGATGAPEFVHTAVWSRGIPQYERTGYGRFLADLAEAETAHPGLHFTGNFRGGVSVVAAMDRADALAARLAGE